MKSTLNTFIALAVVAIISVSCGGGGSGAEKYVPADTTGTAIIRFEEMEHDFGTINAGEQVGCIFIFINNGDADLVITQATASCGCTAPKYSKKPVPPGGKGSIEVVFDSSGRSGKQTKTVMVQSNAENKLIILRIIAEVKTDESIN